MDDASNEVYDFIFKLDRRIGYLEKDLDFIEKNIQGIDAYKMNMYSSMELEVAQTKENISLVKESLRKLVLAMTHLSSQMKDVVKKEQAEALKNQVDNIPIDDFITRTDMRKWQAK